MNPFLLERDERMANWKAMRNGLAEMSEDDQMAKVAQYWSLAPLMKCAYDSYELEKWPGPWEMVMAGDWCRDSVAVGMEFTLRISGWSPDRLSLVMIRDYDLSDQMLALKIDNKILLNYSVGEVISYPKTSHEIIFEYGFNGRSYTSLR